MSKYINREILLQQIKTARNQALISKVALKKLYTIVKEAPDADVEPVKHGKWEMTEGGAAYCTACKGKLNPYCYGYQRCPRCGARMDGVEVRT